MEPRVHLRLYLGQRDELAISIDQLRPRIEIAEEDWIGVIVTRDCKTSANIVNRLPPRPIRSLDLQSVKPVWIDGIDRIVPLHSIQVVIPRREPQRIVLQPPSQHRAVVP